MQAKPFHLSVFLMMFFTASAQAQQADDILTRLETPIAEVALDQVSAVDALEWWQQTTHINLIINPTEMEDIGLDPYKPISLNLHDVSAATVLIRLMNALEDPFLPREAELVVYVYDDYVELLTKNIADRELQTVQYDIGAEVVPIYDNFQDAPDIDLDNIGQSGSGGSSGGGNSIFDSDNQDDSDNGRSRAELGEEIVDMIRQTVEPEIWQANGGEVGRVSFRRDRLIIRAPAYVHDQIPFARFNRR